jgi:hypothetical protein
MESPFAFFAGAQYYPAPGFRDYSGSFATLDEAKAAADKYMASEGSYSWVQVVDLRTCKIVYGEGSGHSGLFGEVKAGPESNALVEALRKSGHAA